MFKILYVERSSFMRKIVAKILAGNGFDCRTTDSEKEALELVENSFVDLVITGLELNGGTGEDLTEKIKSKHPEIEVVVLSGTTNAATIRKLYAAGIYSYIAKDEMEKKLIETLQHLDQQR